MLRNALFPVAALLAAGSAQADALRVENTNGMQEAVYDTAEPFRPAVTGGTPSLVNEGAGDHSVSYGR